MKQHEVDKVHAYVRSGKYNKSEIARMMGVSRTSITRALKKQPTEQAKVTIERAVEEKEETHKEDIIDIIKSDQMSDILDKTMALLNNNQTLEAEVKTKGINPIVNLMDKILDKRIRIVEMEYRLKMDEQQNTESLEIISAISEKLEDFNSRATINMTDVVDPASLRDTDVS